MKWHVSAAHTLRRDFARRLYVCISQHITRVHMLVSGGWLLVHRRMHGMASTTIHDSL